MSVSKNVPDGTFVKEIAELVHPEPRVESLGRGRHIVLAGGKHEIIGELPLASPVTLAVSTLSAIVDGYEKREILKTATESPFIQVVSPTVVRLVDPSVGNERQAFVYIESTALVPKNNFGNFQPIDQFIINVQSNFAETPERARLLSYVGMLTAGLATNINDDGVGQQVVSRKGITRAGDTSQFENPVFLIPFRTFEEVAQPEGAFILRLEQKGQGDSITALAALFEADGGQWRAEATRRIGEWFREKLPEGATVLA